MYLVAQSGLTVLSHPVQPVAGNGEKGGDEISRSLEVDPTKLSAEDKDALDGDHINLELGFAYRAEPSGDSAQSKARNIQCVFVVVSLAIG